MSEIISFPMFNVQCPMFNVQCSSQMLHLPVLHYICLAGLKNTEQRPRWRQGCLINTASSVLTVQSSVAICDRLLFDLVHHKLASCLQRNFLLKYFYLLGSISRQGSYITGLTVLKKTTPCCVMMCVYVSACVCVC